MSWFEVTISACAVMLTIVTTLVKLGVWTGRHAGAQVADAAAIRRIDEEVKALRTWRHKVGEDPCHALAQLFQYHEQRLTKVESKVLNGSR